MHESTEPLNHERDAISRQTHPEALSALRCNQDQVQMILYKKNFELFRNILLEQERSLQIFEQVQFLNPAI